jgi:hypothetical protein
MSLVAMEQTQCMWFGGLAGPLIAHRLSHQRLVHDMALHVVGAEHLPDPYRRPALFVAVEPSNSEG